MDREVALRQLCDYWSQVEQAQKLPRFAGQRGPALEALNKQLPVINRILRELAPDAQLLKPQWISDHAATWPRISRAMEIIHAGRELEEQQWTGGGPAFPLSLLDPMISEVAIPLWEANKFRQAVGDAATSLSHFAQERLGRHDVSDTGLMTEAFSNDPPKEGRPRIRCPGDHRLVAVKDQQNGARQIAAGAFLAIRNPAHHLTGDWNPVTAFHYLTILSQVAHYFRYWEVVRYQPPPPDLNEVLAVYQQSQAKQTSLARRD